MLLANAPAKLVLPFAETGDKNTIPSTSQIGIVDGAASLPDGFPPLTRTALAAGGVPPSGQDMNGILYALSAVLRWINAGGGFPFDAGFAGDANVTGYPKGARVLRADGGGYWLNVTDANTTDPESAGAYAAGWRPEARYGTSAIAVTTADVTATPAEYCKPMLIVSGALTGNRSLILPVVGEWTVKNSTTGAYSLTVKTAAGGGVVVPQGKAMSLAGDTANIVDATSDKAPLLSPTFLAQGGPEGGQISLQKALSGSALAGDIAIDTIGNILRIFEDAGTFRGVSLDLSVLDAAVGSYLVTSENIGAQVQAYDADLAAIAALVSAADKMPYATGAGTWALATLTAWGRARAADADQAAARSALAVNLVDNTSDATKNAAAVALTNKTLSLASNTLTGTKAQFNTACSDGDFVFSSDQPASLAASGYAKFSNGFMIQWGETAVGALDAYSITFPVAFPNACLIAFGGYATVADSIIGALGNVTKTTTGVSGNAQGTGAATMQYIAIGY